MKVTDHILIGFKAYSTERNTCLYSKSSFQLIVGEVVGTRGEDTTGILLMNIVSNCQCNLHLSTCRVAQLSCLIREVNLSSGEWLATKVTTGQNSENNKWLWKTRTHVKCPYHTQPQGSGTIVKEGQKYCKAQSEWRTGPQQCLLDVKRLLGLWTRSSWGCLHKINAVNFPVWDRLGFIVPPLTEKVRSVDRYLLDRISFVQRRSSLKIDRGPRNDPHTLRYMENNDWSCQKRTENWGVIGVNLRGVGVNMIKCTAWKFQAIKILIKK